MIDRDIILDLLPLYRAGLGTAKTREAVEAWLREHPEPGEDRPAMAESGDWRAPFDRARRVSRWRRRSYGLAIALTVLCLALHITTGPDGAFHVQLLALEAPIYFAPLALGAIVAWIAYWRIARGR
jgi:hypothetical protein